MNVSAAGKTTASRTGTGRSGPTRREADRRTSQGNGYGSLVALARLALSILSIFVCIAFTTASVAFIMGLLTADYVLLGFVFWVLPRLGLIALCILLVRFVTAPETQPQSTVWKDFND